jgi:ribonucleoside-diphosphate reductase alpha chain
MNTLPPQAISQDVLAEKYLADGEQSEQDLFARVARAWPLEKPELQTHWEQQFLSNLQRGAIGAGRIMAAAGLDTKATLINCFVQPVADATNGFDTQGNPGIYTALSQAAETMRRGGGVGYDFSNLRPRGALVRGTNSFASGPCSFIDVFDASCTTVESAGARRGAQMGVLRIDHPDVLEFITAKRQKGRWNNFNVSVGVSSAFMQAVRDDAEWELVHVASPSEAQIQAGAHRRDDGLWVYRSQPARTLWDAIMRSAYDFAEPGILFLDNINADNNLWYAEQIAATNPCGEQPCRPMAAAIWAPSYSRALCASRSHPRLSSTWRPFAPPSRFRCACWTTCWTPPSGRCPSSSARHSKSAASAWASQDWAMR